MDKNSFLGRECFPSQIGEVSCYSESFLRFSTDHFEIKSRCGNNDLIILSRYFHSPFQFQINFNRVPNIQNFPFLAQKNFYHFKRLPSEKSCFSYMYTKDENKAIIQQFTVNNILLGESREFDWIHLWSEPAAADAFCAAAVTARSSCWPAHVTSLTLVTWALAADATAEESDEVDPLRVPVAALSAGHATDAEEPLTLGSVVSVLQHYHATLLNLTFWECIRSNLTF